MTTKTTVGLIGVLAFLLGASYLVYMGRPVMKLPPQTPATVATSTLPAASATSTPEGITTTTKSAPKPVDAAPELKAPAVPTPKPTPAPTPTPAPAPTPVPTPTPAPNTFTLSDVRAHSSAASCWSIVNGNVYDLTSWISRHPGGEEPIMGMCGTDGTAAYTDQHGSSRRPASALILLKIGTLR